jgi:glycosyltransferase involved in cell wall biosynthesis
MKILHISTYEKGGAAKAAIRLHLGLLKLGFDSHILFLIKSNESTHTPKSYYFPQKLSLYKRIIYKLRLKQSINSQNQKKTIKWKSEYEGFSLARTDFKIYAHPLFKEANIINLHWVAKFLDYPTFFKNSRGKKLVWTLHDMNAFTGGCHYAWNCHKFQTSCESCPQFKEELDTAKASLLTKQEALLNVNLNIVTPSNWLYLQSKQSLLFSGYETRVIPYGIDSSVFKIYKKNYLRGKYNIPKNRKIILFVSQMVKNKRKGISYLYEAIEKLGISNDVVLCIVGESRDIEFSVESLKLGTIDDERLMAKIYASADLFVIPSLQDNLPNTVLESLMCGTPVIGFNTGGIKDMIEDGKNGVLCDSETSNSLKVAIEAFLKNKIQLSRGEIRKSAVDKYSLEKQAKAYAKLYDKLLAL